MNLKRAQEIRDYYDIIDDDDMSTEMLFSLVSEHFGIDNGDVSEALRLTMVLGRKDGGE